jgi:hypothetical protein
MISVGKENRMGLTTGDSFGIIYYDLENGWGE